MLSTEYRDKYGLATTKGKILYLSTPTLELEEFYYITDMGHHHHGLELNNIRKYHYNYTNSEGVTDSSILSEAVLFLTLFGLENSFEKEYIITVEEALEKFPYIEKIIPLKDRILSKRHLDK